MSNEAILEKGVKLCTQINDLSDLLEEQNELQSILIVSFDVYCTLLEYTVYLHQFDSASGSTVEDFLRSDDLVFETNNRRLDVKVDFFLPNNSVYIQ